MELFEYLKTIFYNNSFIVISYYIYKYRFLFSIPVVYNKFIKYFWYFAKQVPLVNIKINEKMNKIEADIYTDLTKKIKDISKYSILPNSLEETVIYEKLIELKDTKTTNKVSGAIYKNSPELDKFIYKIFPLFYGSNALHPNIFPGLKKMEADIVKMTLNLFNGDDNSLGTLTSGGTESILLACKTYRDIGFSKGIKNPEIIIANSAHAAFNKACQYFKIKLNIIGVSKNTGKLDINELKHTINSNTILVVCSAPSYNHGIVDDIEEIANITETYNIGLHLDSCLGGFILPFLETDFKYNFELKGVTSISADFHKYGLTPKGISIIMYRSVDLLHYQYFVNSKWTGGIYATATIAGSRPGNIIAMTWATMLRIGKDGYIKFANDIIQTLEYIKNRVSKLNNIFVYGDPKICVIGFGSNDLDIYFLGEKMNEKGWNLSSLQYPNSIHLCITHYHTDPEIRSKFVDDLDSCIKQVMLLPKSDQKPASIYGTTQKISNIDFVDEACRRYLDCLYK
jgi:sphinganine-1-phosphate aldolase